MYNPLSNKQYFKKINKWWFRIMCCHMYIYKFNNFLRILICLKWNFLL